MGQLGEHQDEQLLETKKKIFVDFRLMGLLKHEFRSLFLCTMGREQDVIKPRRKWSQENKVGHIIFSHSRCLKDSRNQQHFGFCCSSET